MTSFYLLCSMINRNSMFSTSLSRSWVRRLSNMPTPSTKWIDSGELRLKTFLLYNMAKYCLCHWGATNITQTYERHCYWLATHAKYYWKPSKASCSLPQASKGKTQEKIRCMRASHNNAKSQQPHEISKYKIHKITSKLEIQAIRKRE